MSIGYPTRVHTAPTVNVANGITVARILCTPPLIALVLSSPRGSHLVALGFAILALSDALDGYIARSRRLITDLGKLLDPVADKLLVGGVLIALVATDRLAAGVAVVIIGREALVSALRAVALRQGTVLAAGRLGKAKMALQVAMVLSLLAFGASGAAWLDVLVGATVAMTILSGLSLFAAFVRGGALRGADAS
jgi:CDP-diacylglycerol---glycerol-3-phosphate 3-phosphatidyltransferase